MGVTPEDPVRIRHLTLEEKARLAYLAGFADESCSWFGREPTTEEVVRALGRFPKWNGLTSEGQR